MIRYTIDIRIQLFPATQKKKKANCEKTKIESEKPKKTYHMHFSRQLLRSSLELQE
jgi:hypothetical protein